MVCLVCSNLSVSSEKVLYKVVSLAGDAVDARLGMDRNVPAETRFWEQLSHFFDFLGDVGESGDARSFMTGCDAEDLETLLSNILDTFP